MLGIVIITYNVPSLITRQIELINRFCKDEFEIIIIDNSTSQQAANSIKYHALQSKCRYIRTKATSHNGSESHAFAANFSYQTLRGEFDFMFYMDHDLFPVKEFSVKNILEIKMFAGIPQEKSKTYFWPGCFMIDNRSIDQSIVDFSVSNKLGLDTGGNLYKLIEEYGVLYCEFFDEVHVQNPDFNKSFYNFYSLINNGMFLHMINGSNWNNASDNEERINSLLNILETITK